VANPQPTNGDESCLTTIVKWLRPAKTESLSVSVD
jgi:hypothetical protein